MLVRDIVFFTIQVRNLFFIFAHKMRLWNEILANVNTTRNVYLLLDVSTKDVIGALEELHHFFVAGSGIIL